MSERYFEGEKKDVACALIEKLKKPILVIDNDPGSLFFLRFCLARQGFSVDVAGSGGKEIEKIKNKSYSADN